MSPGKGDHHIGSGGQEIEPCLSHDPCKHGPAFSLVKETQA
jgi:hypothetical protein